MKKILFIIFILIPCMSFGQVYDDHEIAYIDGETIYMNEKDGFMIGVSSSKSNKNIFDKNIKITFTFINNTGTTINILHKNISAEYLNKNGNAEPIEIRTYEDVRKTERNKVFWFGPNNNEMRSTKTEVKNGCGSTIYSVNTETEVYTGRKDDAYENVDKELEGYLRDNTLYDGDHLNGYILIKKPYAKIFSLKIKIRNATYRYTLPIE